MRGIKFRYWDMVRKEFITDGDVYYAAEDYILAGDIDNPPVVDVTGRVQMSQYTGLKDKNGQEIYEGDILSAFHGTQITAVAWNEEFGLYGIVLQVSGLSEPMEELLGNHLDVVEVIGNIYENPELLEGI